MVAEEREAPAAAHLAASGPSSAASSACPALHEYRRIGAARGLFQSAARRTSPDSRSSRANLLRLDRLWWLATPGNPLKSAAAEPRCARGSKPQERLPETPDHYQPGFEARNGSRCNYNLGHDRWLESASGWLRFVWIIGDDNLSHFISCLAVTGYHRRSRADLVVIRPGSTFAGAGEPRRRTPWRDIACPKRRARTWRASLPPASSFLFCRGGVPAWASLEPILEPARLQRTSTSAKLDGSPSWKI